MAAAAAETEPTAIWGQLLRMLRIVKWAAGALAVLFLVLLAQPAIALVHAASGVHPALGWTVGIALGAGLAALVGVPAVKYWRAPRIVVPPALPEDRPPTPKELARTVRWLEALLGNGARHPLLASERGPIASAQEELRQFGEKLRTAAAADGDRLHHELAEWSERTLPPIWRPIEEEAERLIHEEAITVGIATALSPNGTLDAFVMVWRSSRLVSRLAALNYGRPGLRGTFLVLRDVAIATAAAGYMQSVSESLGNLILHTLGGVTGLIAGPAVDGVTNALVLTRIGYLAQARCRALQRWTPKVRKNALLSALAATQRVALGLTSEIFRKAGVGLGTVAGAAASTVARAAESAAGRIGSAAEAAIDTAAGWTSSLKKRLFGDPTPPRS
jgi:hypothetical protein